MKPRPSRAQPRRDMTTDEKAMALALSPMKVRYVAGSPDKRFAWTMADDAEHAALPQITTRQAEYLITLCIRMRRQIPADVLAIAERLAQRPRRRPGGSVALAVLAIALAVGGAACL